jgi:hypothetical protein
MSQLSLFYSREYYSSSSSKCLCFSSSREGVSIRVRHMCAAYIFYNISITKYIVIYYQLLCHAYFIYSRIGNICQSVNYTSHCIYISQLF